MKRLILLLTVSILLPACSGDRNNSNKEEARPEIRLQGQPNFRNIGRSHKSPSAIVSAIVWKKAGNGPSSQNDFYIRPQNNIDPIKCSIFLLSPHLRPQKVNYQNIPFQIGS